MRIDHIKPRVLFDAVHRIVIDLMNHKFPYDAKGVERPISECPALKYISCYHFDFRAIFCAVITQTKTEKHPKLIETADVTHAIEVARAETKKKYGVSSFSSFIHQDADHQLQTYTCPVQTQCQDPAQNKHYDIEFPLPVFEQLVYTCQRALDPWEILQKTHAGDASSSHILV